MDFVNRVILIIGLDFLILIQQHLRQVLMLFLKYLRPLEVGCVYELGYPKIILNMYSNQIFSCSVWIIKCSFHCSNTFFSWISHWNQFLYSFIIFWAWNQISSLRSLAWWLDVAHVWFVYRGRLLRRRLNLLRRLNRLVDWLLLGRWLLGRWLLCSRFLIWIIKKSLYFDIHHHNQKFIFYYSQFS